jgi:hypothetical protein
MSIHGKVDGKLPVFSIAAPAADGGREAVAMACRIGDSGPAALTNWTGMP